MAQTSSYLTVAIAAELPPFSVGLSTVDGVCRRRRRRQKKIAIPATETTAIPATRPPTTMPLFELGLSLLVEDPEEGEGELPAEVG